MPLPMLAAAAIPAVGSLAGAGIDYLTSSAAADKSWKHQKKMAQNAIQWRVNDAIAAGLHPLAALGVPVASYSSEVGAQSNFAGAFSDMGQNLTRAMTAPTAAAPTAIEAAFQGLQLEHQKLMNDKLASEIRILNQPGTPPGLARPTMLGNTKVSDPTFADRAQSAYDDWISGPLGAMKFMEDSWNTAKSSGVNPGDLWNSYQDWVTSWSGVKQR